MEELLQKLSAIAQSKATRQPEEVILINLLQFQSLLPEKPMKMELENMESVLLSLMKVNQGNLSPYCASIIGKNLVSIYNLDKSKAFWNLTSLATSSPTPANIFAVAQVIKRIGKFSRSSLSGLTQSLTSAREPIIFPALVALRSLFKVCGKVIDKSAPSAFSLAKQYVYHNSEIIQVAAVRLLQVLVSYPSITQKKMLALCEGVLKSAKSQFTINEAAHTAALCAVIPFIKKEEAVDDGEPANTDFAIKSKPKKEEKVNNLENSFTIIRRFKSQFSIVFQRFLDFLDPSFVFTNAMKLFGFAMEMCPVDNAKVMAFFAKDIRTEIFKYLLTSHQNFGLLRTMVYDQESARTVADISLEKIWNSNDPQEKSGAGLYITALANSYPEIALEYLHKATNYLSEPPTDKKSNDLEYEGMTKVAALIITAIDNKQRVITAEGPILRKILRGIEAENPLNPTHFSCSLMLLSTLPNTYINDDYIDLNLTKLADMLAQQASLDEKYRRIPNRLIEHALLFLSTHSSLPSACKLAIKVMPMISLLSNVAHLAYLQLVTKITLTTQQVSSIAFYFLNKIGSLQFTIPFVRKRVPGLMRTVDDIFNKPKPISIARSPLFFVDESILAAKLVDLMPLVFAKLSDNDIPKFMNVFYKNSSKLSLLMVVLALYQTESTRKSIPVNYHESMLKMLSPDRIIHAQIISECIAIHCNAHRDTFVTITGYLAKTSNQASFLLEASLARHINMTDIYIKEVIARIGKQAANPQLASYMLHSIACLYEAKSVQMVALMIGDQQCQLFLNLMSQPNQTYGVYFLIALCIEKLIPILLPFLTQDTTDCLVRTLLQAYQIFPHPIMTQFFHHIYRAIIAFSPKIANYFSIHYPTSRWAAVDLKLLVCGTLADLSKINPLPLDLFDLVPSLIVLLQRTKDERPSKFIVAIAKTMYIQEFVPAKMTAWFRLAKQILSANSTPGFGSSTVEPNVFVKSCMLLVIHALLPLLARREPLLTDCLDDLMTSTIRAIETAKVELHLNAYPILKDVVDLFRYKRTEGQGRLLELYESQFSIATRFAFPGSVDVSSDFLVTYLDYCFDDFERNQQSFLMLLEGFVHGLQKVVDKESGFFCVASKICVLARFSQPICDHFIPFLRTLTPVFAQMILDSIRLRSTKTSWNEVSSYRQKMSPFYHNLLPSFVWLSYEFPLKHVKINTATMLSFFLLEMTISSESWRIFAAVSAISATFQYFSNEIDNDMFALIVNATSDVARKNTILVSSLIPEFSLFAARYYAKCENNPEIWNQISYIVLKNSCNSETLGILLDRAPTTDLTIDFAKFIIKQLIEGVLGEKEGIALMTILYAKEPEAIPEIINELCTAHPTIDTSYASFKITMIKRGLLRCETRVQFDKIAAFCIKNFRRGGMTLISQILVRRPNIGIEFLARGAANEAVLRIADSIDDAKSSLNFLLLILQQTRSIIQKGKVAVDVAKAAFFALARWSGDRKFGKDLSTNAILVLKECDSINPNASKEAYDTVNTDDKVTMIKSLNKFAADANKTTKKLSLVKFSTRVKRKQQTEDDGWQSLDMDD